MADTKITPKDLVMGQQRKNAFLTSMSHTFAFLAGILTTVGMAVSLKDFAGEIGKGFTTAITSIEPIGLGLIGAALACTAVAVAAGYGATLNYTSANYDQLEINAQHTAKYLVKEIKQETGKAMAEHEQNQRADGKSWVQVVRPTADQTRQQS